MTQAVYLRDLQSIARGYWSGIFTQDQAYDLFFNAIDRGLTRAWQVGAREAGIMPNEITPTEQVQLMTIIFKEYSYVPGLMTFINANSKANKGLLRTVFARLNGWAVRFKDVMNRAKMSGEKDPKMKWELGPTKWHCGTCAKLAGKVKQASWWQENVMPQQPKNDKLECGGWRCQCVLSITDEPMSRGRMPNLP